jgi:catechol 2,3-dioxygenase-like lactoylglutathione lyase family enzyme
MATVSVRYIVHDTDAAVAFYRDRLGFRVDMQPNPYFAMLSLGDLRLVLSRPGGGPGGGSTLADGRQPQPGGWNRFQLEVPDVEAMVERLRAAGVSVRGDVVSGVGVKQAIIEDPSGNPVELDEPVLPEAGLGATRG